MKIYLHTLISILTTVMMIFATENMDASSRRPNQSSGSSDRENVTTTTRGRRPQATVSTQRSQRQPSTTVTTGRRPSRPSNQGTTNHSGNRKPSINTSSQNVNLGGHSQLQGNGRRPISGIQNIKDTDKPLGYRPHYKGDDDDDDDDDDDKYHHNGYRPHYNGDDDDDDDDDKYHHNGYRPHYDGDDDDDDDDDRYRPHYGRHDRDDDDWYDDDRRHHGHGYYPGAHNPGGYKPHHGGHWRPIAPPHRPYRPVPHYHYCPPYPVNYTPYYRAPIVSAIFGLDFGLSIRVSIDNLYNGGYHLDGYDNDKVYLRNVKYLGVHWDDAIVYYDRFDRMNNISFYDSSNRYNMRRYNKLYKRLCREYGRPAVTNNYGNELEVSWWDRYGEHFVTLSFGSRNSFGGPSRYYTTLTIGVR